MDDPESPADSNDGLSFLEGNPYKMLFPRGLQQALVCAWLGIPVQEPFLWWLDSVFFGCSQFQETD